MRRTHETEKTNRTSADSLGRGRTPLVRWSPPDWRAVVTLAAIGSLVLFGACTNNSLQSPNTGSADGGAGCTPGRTLGCVCPDGTRGSQTCTSDGTWGSCNCRGETGTTEPDTTAEPKPGSSEDTGVDSATDTGIDGSDASAKQCCAFSNLDSANSVSCRGMSFDRIVHVVDDLGADPNGNQRIDSILENDLSDGTLLVFPTGTYKTGEVDLDGKNIGLVAEQGATPTFVPAEPRDQMGEVIWSYGGDGGLLLQGLEFDYTAEGYGGRLAITPNGDFTICDIHLRGAFPHDTKGFRLDVRDENAKGLIERAVMTGGPEEPEYDWNGIYVGSEHSGSLTIRDCVVANASNNGIYASSPGQEGGGNGPVKVIGGLYKNNNIAGVRIGSSNSVVRGVDVIVDSTVPLHNGRNARGIRVRDRGGQLIEDCDVKYGPNATSGSGAVSIHSEARGATIRNVRIEMSRDDMPAIRGKSPDVGGKLGLTVENVSISGSASDGAAIDIADRPNSVIRNSCIAQSGSNRDGIEFTDSNGSSVNNTAIDVSGTQVVGSGVSTSNVTSSANCTSPTVNQQP